MNWDTMMEMWAIAWRAALASVVVALPILLTAGCIINIAKP